MVGDVLLAQEEVDLLDALGEAGDRLVERDPEFAELVRQKGACEADVEPAARDRVAHGDLAGELEGVIEDREHGAGDQTCSLGPLRGSGEEEQRVGAVAAIPMEVVLHDADRVVPEPVSGLGDVECVAEVVLARFNLRRYRRKELDPKLQRSALRRCEGPALGLGSSEVPLIGRPATPAETPGPVDD